MSAREEKVPVEWYRSTIFCAFLVAGTAFTCPSIFGALNGLGAGGGASPNISNTANAMVFGMLTVGSLFVGAIVNRITPKWALLIGTLGCTPYAAGLYCIDKFDTFSFSTSYKPAPKETKPTGKVSATPLLNSTQNKVS